MIKTKRILKIMMISILSILLLLNTYAYAAVEVTDENLNEALQKYVESTENENNKISVENNVIKGNVDNFLDFEMKYNLTEKPTFTIEIPVQNGMTYEEYEFATGKLINVWIGYIAVANIQGTDFDAATRHLMFTYLDCISDSDYSENDIVIVDDTNDNTIEKTDDPNTYYVSEFPEKVMEYTNRVCKGEILINDADNFNSFQMVIEKQDETEASCKLVSTLTINTDADFAQLNEKYESALDSDITKENADYVIELKEGQKCKIESSEKIRGYSIYNDNCVEFSEDYTEITALEPGETTGYLYIGEYKEITLYITVVDNTGNEVLDPVILKIGETDTPDESTNNGDDEFVVTVPGDTNEKDDTVVNSTEIPKAGTKDVILFSLIAFVILVIIIGRNVNKYKGI